MSESEHSVGVEEINLVVRNLKLCHVNNDNKRHNNWWSRVKTGYYRFVDQNVKENAQHKPLSCHNAPGNTKNANNISGTNCYFIFKVY